MFDREIFRQKALDKLSTPDDLDELLQINTKSSWLLLVSLICLIVCGIIWGVFGQIINKVTLIGSIHVVDPPRNLIVNDAGQVDSIYHWPGDKVLKDEPIVKYISYQGNTPKYISAPFNGVLLELNISPGIFLTSGMTIAKISSAAQEKNTNPEFMFFVNEKDISQLKTGQKVEILMKGNLTKSNIINSEITYLAKLPSSDEYINSIIPDKDVFSQLKKGSYYLVRTYDDSNSLKDSLPEGFSQDYLYGKIFMGQVVVSRLSPIAYLLSSSK